MFIIEWLNKLDLILNNGWYWPIATKVLDIIRSYQSATTIGHLGDVHVLQSSPVCFLVLFINFFYEFETILVLTFFIGRVLLIVKINISILSVKEKSEHGPVVLFSRETSTKIKNTMTRGSEV